MTQIYTHHSSLLLQTQNLKQRMDVAYLSPSDQDQTCLDLEIGSPSFQQRHLSKLYQSAEVVCVLNLL